LPARFVKLSFCLRVLKTRPGLPKLKRAEKGRVARKRFAAREIVCNVQCEKTAAGP
jgi:hypothetical protein